MKILYSPNCSKKIRKNKEIKVIVIHYTGMQSKIASIRRLLSKRHKVSCHYLIDQKGEIIKMVEENREAWHAGKSKWKNFNNLNKNSIGIELVNKGHEFGYEKFSNLQIKKLINLCLHLKKKYKIKNSNILGHSDIAPLRKKDPGEKFPWKFLAKRKIGVWHNLNIRECCKLRGKKNIDNKYFFRKLKKFGYFVNTSKKNELKKIVNNFQRRFRPELINGKIDRECVQIVKTLI